MPLLGVDTGGTFTDFVLVDGDDLRVHKLSSTPAAPEQAILQGIHELGLADCEDLVVVHGSTVATNAVLEAKGVRTVFITNRGLRDILTIGRQARRELYNLNPAPVQPPVPRELCLETGGRLAADGTILDQLSDDDLQTLRAQLETLAPRAVAVSLLFSYLDPEMEQRIAEVIPEGMFVSLSSTVLPEYREYERGIATWLNASVGPLVSGYLQRLCQGMPRAQVAVMQSSGGTIGAAHAGDQAVNMLLSGPAGGMAGARYSGLQANRRRLLTFDMGGTSTDVALMDGGEADELGLTTEGRIGPYPVGVPMVDMYTIGAGGGSIARLDAGGLLQVGPESAGADPGPACYGRGGVEATVTDANLVLGRLRSEDFLGGGMRLDRQAASRAVDRIATQLGISTEAAASGIIDLANEHMVRALRVMSVQRGVDPSGLTLVSFGGAGGLHVCALAEALEIRQALVPVHAGVLSALGMLVAPRVRHLSQTLKRLLSEVDDALLEHEFGALAQQGRTALQEEGIPADELVAWPSVDLRYAGQSYSINLAWRDREQAVRDFHERHHMLYGHSLSQPVELVTLRVRVQGKGHDIRLSAPDPAEQDRAPKTVKLAGIKGQVPVYPRTGLVSDGRVIGPALITETVSTTFLAPGWEAVLDDSGSLLLSLRE